MVADLQVNGPSYAVMYRNYGCSGVREWLGFHAVKILRTLTELVANVIFALVICFQRKQSLPDITDPVLLHSAVTLAEKIRNREVPVNCCPAS
jgi:hypothetical protein